MDKCNHPKLKGLKKISIHNDQELEGKLALHAEQSHQQLRQMRLDNERDRRHQEDGHHSKLAAEFRQHDELEAEIVRLHRKRTKYPVLVAQ